MKGSEYKCIQCNSQFGTYDQLYNHLTVCAVKRCIRCNNRTFKTVEELDNHINTEHVEYPCYYKCGKGFSSLVGLNTHLRNEHSGQTLETHQCRSCDKTFLTHKQAIAHFRATHPTQHGNMHKCDDCKLLFSTANDVFYHICTGNTVIEQPNLQKHLEKQYQDQLAAALSASLDDVNAPQQRLLEFDSELDELAYVMDLSMDEFQGQEAAAIDAGFMPDGFPLKLCILDEITRMGIDWKVLRLVCKQWKDTVDLRLN